MQATLNIETIPPPLIIKATFGSCGVYPQIEKLNISIIESFCVVSAIIMADSILAPMLHFTFTRSTERSRTTNAGTTVIQCSTNVPENRLRMSITSPVAVIFHPISVYSRHVNAKGTNALFSIFRIFL